MSEQFTKSGRYRTRDGRVARVFVMGEWLAGATEDELRPTAWVWFPTGRCYASELSGTDLIAYLGPLDEPEADDAMPTDLLPSDVSNVILAKKIFGLMARVAKLEGSDKELQSQVEKCVGMDESFMEDMADVFSRLEKLDNRQAALEDRIDKKTAEIDRRLARLEKPQQPAQVSVDGLKEKLSEYQAGVWEAAATNLGKSKEPIDKVRVLFNSVDALIKRTDKTNEAVKTLLDVCESLVARVEKQEGMRLKPETQFVFDSTNTAEPDSSAAPGTGPKFHYVQHAGPTQSVNAPEPLAAGGPIPPFTAEALGFEQPAPSPEWKPRRCTVLYDRYDSTRLLHDVYADWDPKFTTDCDGNEAVHMTEVPPPEVVRQAISEFWCKQFGCSWSPGYPNANLSKLLESLGIPLPKEGDE